MKAYYLLAPLGAAALVGCTYYSPPVAYTYYSRPVAYTTPATVTYVSPIYVAPKPIVLGGTPD